MQFRILLDVLGLEVIAPEDLELLLADLGVLFFDGDHADEVAARRGVVGIRRQLIDLLDHLRDRVGGDLRGRRVVDSAGDVAMGVNDHRGLQETTEHR